MRLYDQYLGSWEAIARLNADRAGIDPDPSELTGEGAALDFLRELTCSATRFGVRRRFVVRCGHWTEEDTRDILWIALATGLESVWGHVFGTCRGVNRATLGHLMCSPCRLAASSRPSESRQTQRSPSCGWVSDRRIRRIDSNVARLAPTTRSYSNRKLWHVKSAEHEGEEFGRQWLSWCRG